MTAEKWVGGEGEGEEIGNEEAIGEYVGNHPENDPTKLYLYYFNKIGLEEVFYIILFLLDIYIFNNQ